MKSAPIQCAVLGLFCLALTGCVSVHKVAIKDAPRRDMAFESPEAVRVFYDALLSRRYPKDDKPSRVTAGQTLYTRETRPSANVAFNDGASQADVDANGMITVQEARVFASTDSK